MIPILSTGFAGYLGTSTTAAFILSVEAAGSIPTIAAADATPFAWAAGDALNLNGCYEAATG